MATSLWDYYSQKGQALPSVQERKQEFNLGSGYTGTGPQNQALLSRIQGGGGAPSSPPPTAATAPSQGVPERLQGMPPETQAIFNTFINAANKNLPQGFKILITEGFRSDKRQSKLFAQGRTAPGNIVTGARPGESLHNQSRAIDLTFIDPTGRTLSPNEARDAGLYQLVLPSAQEAGLEWGGNFKGLVDMPHFQLPGQGSTARAVKASLTAAPRDTSTVRTPAAPPTVSGGPQTAVGAPVAPQAGSPQHNVLMDQARSIMKGTPSRTVSR